MPDQSNEYIMEAKGISKSFPGVKALSNVDVNIRAGEVVALLGEMERENPR